MAIRDKNTVDGANINDGSIAGAKLETNIALAGTLDVADDLTADADLIVSSQVAVGGGSIDSWNRIYAYKNDASDGPMLHLEQAGSGDVSIGFELTGTKSWSIGVDNSVAGDPFVITDGSNLGTGTRVLVIDGDGNTDIAGGLALGDPTGGNKTGGTLNTAGDIFKNDSAYTNPDFVFELWGTGAIKRFIDSPGAKEYLETGRMTLEETKEFALANWHLPGVMHDEPAGAFARSDIALRHIEELYIHAFEMQERLASLEDAA